MTDRVPDTKEESCMRCNYYREIVQEQGQHLDELRACLKEHHFVKITPDR